MTYLYRMRNGRKEFVLMHELNTISGDCNNVFKVHGKYKVQHDSIIFTTTNWQRTCMDPIPSATKQIYRVTDGGKLMRIYNKEKEHGTGKWIESGN